jgi:hypothetical protein
MGQPIHSAVPSGGISVIPMIYRLQQSSASRPHAWKAIHPVWLPPSLLLLRPYRNYERNQLYLQAKPRFSRYHSISEVLISTFAPPRESLNHGLTFWLVSCYSTELIDIDTRSYRISLVRRGEYETVCQELEISLAVYRYDRLITLTFTLHSKFH